MQRIRKLSLALMLLTLSLIVGVGSAKAAAENSQVGTATLTPLLTNLLNVANTIGDDQFSTADLTAQADPSTTATQHYGPYASGSTDSGTCGNDWANDLFNRHFTIFNRSGAIIVVEQFKDGTFTTPASDSPPVNFSPGGCQNSPVPQGVVNDGVTGNLHGYFIIPLPAGSTQISTSSSCFVAPFTECTTYAFLNSHFIGCASYPSPPCSVTTFFFHYAAGDQGLLDHEWKNASADRGGNSGDIRSTNLP